MMSNWANHIEPISGTGKMPDCSPSGVSHGLEVVGIQFSPAVSISLAHGIAMATIHVLDVTRLPSSPNTSSSAAGRSRTCKAPGPTTLALIQLLN